MMRLKIIIQQKCKFTDETKQKFINVPKQDIFLWNVLGIGEKTGYLSNLNEADLTFNKYGKMRPDRIMHSIANTPLFQSSTYSNR